MSGLRILITNNTLANRAGSELYVRDLATALLRRGHTPIAYSTSLGEVAQDLRAATVPVIDNLDATAPPDVIHGHHHLDTMTALLRFPGVPAVYFCHGWMPWEEAPPQFPRIQRYVAVDQTCADRLMFEHAIPENRIRILLNFVDLERFKPRSPLPIRPQRALIFSNQANESNYVAPVRTACARHGISVDVVGVSMGNACPQPEELLGTYDIVFAKARAALEALAVGTAVVLCDATGAGPMVTSAEFDRLRLLNLGIRTLQTPLHADLIAAEIARYDPDDANEVSRRVRASASVDAAVDEIITLYEEVISEHASSYRQDVDSELQAASRYLRWLSPRLKTVYALEAKANQTASELDRITNERDRITNELDRITSSMGWRLLNRYGLVKHKLILPIYRRIKSVF